MDEAIDPALLNPPAAPPMATPVPAAGPPPLGGVPSSAAAGGMTAPPTDPNNQGPGTLISTSALPPTTPSLSGSSDSTKTLTDAQSKALGDVGKSIMGAGAAKIGQQAHQGTDQFNMIFHGTSGALPNQQASGPAPIAIPQVAPPPMVQVPTAAVSDRRAKSKIREANDQTRAFLDAIRNGRF